MCGVYHYYLVLEAQKFEYIIQSYNTMAMLHECPGAWMVHELSFCSRLTTVAIISITKTKVQLHFTISVTLGMLTALYMFSECDNRKCEWRGESSCIFWSEDRAWGWHSCVQRHTLHYYTTCYSKFGFLTSVKHFVSISVKLWIHICGAAAVTAVSVANCVVLHAVN